MTSLGLGLFTTALPDTIMLAPAWVGSEGRRRQRYDGGEGKGGMGRGGVGKEGIYLSSLFNSGGRHSSINFDVQNWEGCAQMLHLWERNGP